MPHFCLRKLLITRVMRTRFFDNFWHRPCYFFSDGGACMRVASSTERLISPDPPHTCRRGATNRKRVPVHSSAPLFCLASKMRQAPSVIFPVDVPDYPAQRSNQASYRGGNLPSASSHVKCLPRIQRPMKKQLRHHSEGKLGSAPRF